MGRRGRGAEMCDWAYHHEALRKARVLERKREAEGRIAREQSMHCGRPAETMDRPPVNQDIQSNYDVRSGALPRFRVNEEGFSNRYRNRANHAPHTDTVYHVMYPGHDNSDYTLDENKKHRKENLQLDKHQIRERVNGPFDIKVLTEVMPSDVE